jgi:hypothetical protein
MVATHKPFLPDEYLCAMVPDGWKVVAEGTARLRAIEQAQTRTLKDHSNRYRQTTRNDPEVGDRKKEKA